MSSLNKVLILGTLGRDPEVRYTQSGSAIANVSIATNERYKDKQTGEQKENTEWHRVVFFGKLAEIAGEYLKKGSLCYVEGQLRTRKWQDKNGQDQYTTEIVAGVMKMIGPRQGGSGNQSQAPQSSGYGNQGQGQQPAMDDDGFDSDIPF